MRADELCWEMSERRRVEMRGVGELKRLERTDHKVAALRGRLEDHIVGRLTSVVVELKEGGGHNARWGVGGSSGAGAACLIVLEGPVVEWMEGTHVGGVGALIEDEDEASGDLVAHLEGG